MKVDPGLPGRKQMVTMATLLDRRIIGKDYRQGDPCWADMYLYNCDIKIAVISYLSFR